MDVGAESFGARLVSVRPSQTDDPRSVRMGKVVQGLLALYLLPVVVLVLALGAVLIALGTLARLLTGTATRMRRAFVAPRPALSIAARTFFARPMMTHPAHGKTHTSGRIR